MKAIINFLLVAGFALEMQAQVDTSGMVRYTPEYRFKDGIFLNFDQVKQDAPLLKSRILTTIDYSSDEFYTLLLSEKKVFFYDDLGTKQEFPSDKIWGYAKNGILYIKVGSEFNRITFVGSISHFVANISNYSRRNYDPYMYDYYNPYMYNPYRYGMPSAGYETKEMRQFLLDFETGKVVDFEVKNVEVLLMKDPQLYDEFVNLSGRKQKQLKFLYVRKYNEKHPLFLPAK
jgi:hypothetical protein